METLAKSNAKRIAVSGSFDVSGLEGIRDLSTGEKTASFLYNGDINSLLRRLSEGEIRDLSISEPDLEEIFLHYYEKEESAR